VGRLTPARSRLRAAHTGLEAMGARLWAERALAELRATGLKHLPSTRLPAQPLTPQEMQVALAVSAGATNREAASSLFLSTKTVEMHLTQVYRKLGVRSRTELARHSQMQ
jgi:DNA-binding NarL/FixJ family response regulator